MKGIMHVMKAAQEVVGNHVMDIVMGYVIKVAQAAQGHALDLDAQEDVIHEQMDQLYWNNIIKYIIQI